MSAFKDAVAADIKGVFINSDEFAETHNLNGRSVLCVIDKNNIIEGRDGKIEGVFLNSLSIHVSKDDLDSIPIEGEWLSIDGSFHIVRSVSEEMGVLVILAEANEQ